MSGHEEWEDRERRREQREIAEDVTAAAAPVMDSIIERQAWDSYASHCLPFACHILGRQRPGGGVELDPVEAANLAGDLADAMLQRRRMRGAP